MGDTDNIIPSRTNGRGISLVDRPEKLQALIPYPDLYNRVLAELAQRDRSVLGQPHPDEAVPIWDWSGAEDLMKPSEPTRYVIGELIPQRSITLLYGEDGSLKSMLAMDLAVCVAIGKEWLVGMDNKANGYKTQQQPVLWYDADNGNDVVKERFVAIHKGHQAWPPNDQLHYLSLPDPLFDASDEERVNHMIGDIQRYQAGLIVFDNLSTISGDIDENAPGIQQVMSALKCIVEVTGVAVILIHHATKNTGGYRGHGRIRAQCDLSLKVARQGRSSDKVAITPDKIRRKPVKPFAGLFTYDNSNDRLIRARFFGTSPDNQRGKSGQSKQDEIKDTIRDLLRNQPGLNQTAIINDERVKVIASRVPVIRALDEMETAGIVVVRPGKRNGKIYQLKLLEGVV